VQEVAQLVARLADADAAARESAALALYQQGCALADAATIGWRREAELAALLAGSPTVGIAVQPRNFEKIHAAFGSPRLAEVPPDQDAREFEVHAGAARLDILTTRAVPGSAATAGAIAKFLEKFGEGIQQVEFPVHSVDRATELLRARFSLQPIYPQTRDGADRTRVNFFLPSTPEGRKVLIELVESASAT
jgi:hypothetical protein